MMMDDAVKNITGQVEVIYEKAISELDQKEGQLDEQIGRLSQRKESLSQKRQQVSRIRDQIGTLMAEIAKAEKQHDHVTEQKAELDQEIDELTVELHDLKRHAKRTQTRLENAKAEKRERYQELAAIIERFGSVKSALPEAFVSEIQENIVKKTSSDRGQQTSMSANPDMLTGSEIDEGTILEEGNSVVVEDEPENFSSLEDELETIDEEEEDFFVDDNEDFLDDFDEGEDEEELAVSKLKETKTGLGPDNKVHNLNDNDPLVDLDFDDSEEESDLITFDDDLGDLVPLEEEFSTETNTEDLDALFSQVELEGRETPEELEALERGDLLTDELLDSSNEVEEFDQLEDDFDSLDDDLDNSELDDDEELTPRTARTPRKRRKLLESYLDDAPQS